MSNAGDEIAVLNTDREIYRGPDEGCGDYYADSLHVTADGRLGINCGGTVHVMPIREWHRLAGGVIGGLGLTEKRPWTLEHAIEIAKIGGPYSSYDGTGGIWDSNKQTFACGRFDDWGLARATTIILNAVIDGRLRISSAYTNPNKGS